MENRELWKSIVLLLCLLPIVALMAYWLGHRAGAARMPNPSRVVAERQATQARPAQTLNEARRKGILNRLESAPHTEDQLILGAAPEQTLRAVCDGDWKIIARATPLQVEDALLRRQPMLKGNCLKRMREDSSVPSIQAFVDACQAKLRSIEENNLRPLCISRVGSFRAYVIWNLKKGDALPERGNSDDLAYQLEGSFENLRDASAKDLDRAIQLADGLIESVPGLYPAYKAKLVAMILKETKFGEAVDPKAYEDLYRELLSFESSGGSEAEPGIRAPELNGMDSDLVHMPFLRLEARGEYDQVRILAEEYVQNYPRSYIGYYYLAESAWKAGNEGEAVEVFRRGLGASASTAAAREMFLRMRGKDALERLSEIKLR